MYRSASILEWPLPIKIKIYEVILNANGTDNPTVTLLNNTTGMTAEWTWEATGIYKVTFSDNLPLTRTTYTTGNANPYQTLTIYHNPGDPDSELLMEQILYSTGNPHSNGFAYQRVQIQIFNATPIN